MDEIRARIRARWNDELTDYDNKHAHGAHDPKEQELWRNLFSTAPKGAKLLDVGTGTGFVALLAAKCGLAVTGVDWSEPMMMQARGKAEALGLSIAFKLGETEGLPFEDATFDLLTSRHVIWTLTDPLTAFKEWVRVLKPGGIAFADYSPCFTGNHGYHHYGEEVEKRLPLHNGAPVQTVEALLREAGFMQISYQVHEQTVNHGDHIHTSEIYLFTCTK